MALELFTQAAQIQMRPGLRMSIAQEQQALGLGRDACESATQCMTDVQADLASPESGRVTQGCAGLVASACVPFGRVRVVTATPVPTVLVRATVGAREAFAQDFSVERGLTASVSLDLTRAAEPVEVAPVVVAPVAVAPVATRVPVVTPHPLRAAAPVASSGGVTSRWWFWTGVGAVVLGGTLVGLAAGGLFDRLADPVGGTAYRVYAVTAQ